MRAIFKGFLNRELKEYPSREDLLTSDPFSTREYALESYEIDVVDYLLKPISFARFFKSVNKFLKPKEGNVVKQKVPISKGRNSIFVNLNKKNVKDYLDDVLYIESIKNYIRIHTEERTIISKDTIIKNEALLPDSFVRIHRSFIVNQSKISAFTA